MVPARLVVPARLEEARRRLDPLEDPRDEVLARLKTSVEREA